MKKHFFYIIGLFLILLYNLPWLLNGENASYRIYDYLEQDFVNLYLNAKYLFHPFVTEIPELFGGTFRGSIQAHSFLQIIMYKFVQGVKFLNLNQIFTQFVGYTGMYVLINKLYNTEKTKIKSFINTGVSFLFCITPLLLHGITILSFPLFVWGIIKIYESKTKKDFILISILYLFLGFSTSLIYCGFVYLLTLFVLSIYFFIKKRKDLALKYFLAMILIFVGYFITYFYTFLSLTEITHRVEMSIPKQKFFPSIVHQLMFGVYALESPIYPLIPYIMLTIATVIVLIQKKETNEYKYMMLTLWAIVLIVLFSAGYTSLTLIVKIRQLYGGVFQSIQWDRISYIISPLYSFIFASSLIFLNEKLKELNIRKSIISFCIIFIFIAQFSLIKKSDECLFNNNINTLLGKPNIERTYAQFFQKDLMNEINKYIGKPQNTYHVVSLGINPGVALFNGFYCLDGYSVNYRLSYKKKWREIVKKELMKNKNHRKFFDYWGSRVYIVHHNYTSYRPQELTIDTTDYVDNIQIDYEKLKKLGGDYLFSKYKIKTPNPHLKLEKVFYSDIDDSFQVFLYSIK